MVTLIDMSTTRPVDRLTLEEIAQARILIEENGKMKAAAMLGLRDLLALMTAVAGFDVHRLTAATIRAHLLQLQNGNTL